MGEGDGQTPSHLLPHLQGHICLFISPTFLNLKHIGSFATSQLYHPSNELPGICSSHPKFCSTFTCPFQATPSPGMGFSGSFPYP